MQLAIKFDEITGEVPVALKELWKNENPAVLAGVEVETEAQLLDAVVETMKKWPKDEVTETKSVESKKWLLVSGLQKSIRRGKAEKARQCGHAVMLLDSAYLWRRLCVIALEDIGWANPMACAMTLAVASSKKFRTTYGEKELLFFLTDMLALGMKDRTLCDWVNVRHTTPEQLHFNRQMFDHQMVNSDMPFLGKFMAVKGRMLMRDPLFLAVLPQWKMLQQSQGFWLHVEDRTETEIRGIPASAYDQHVSVGKRALAYFAKACPAVRKILDEFPFVDKLAVLGGIVFVFEGALLDRQLRFDGWQAVWEGGLDSDYHFMEGMPKEKQLELLDAVSQNLETLHRARARVSE